MDWTNFWEVEEVGVLVFVVASVFVLMLVLGWFVVCWNGLCKTCWQGCVTSLKLILLHLFLLLCGVLK